MSVAAYYRDGVDITLSVPFQNEGGLAIRPVSATYSVLHQNGTELVGPTSVTDVSGLAAAIVVPAINNQLSAGVNREVRIITLVMIDSSGNAIDLDYYYSIETVEQLVPAENSLLRYAEALALAPDFAMLDAWGRNTKRKQIAALIEAYHRLASLRLKPNNDGLTSLTDITVNTLPEIDAKFLDAFRRAQMIEADQILSRNTVDSQRKDGLLSYSNGEVTNFYRTDKPLDLLVSNKALKIVGRYVDYSVRIGRA